MRQIQSMRVLFALLVLLACPAWAASDVPDLTFAQKVTIVVEAKHDPRILDMKINQGNHVVKIDLIVDKNTDRQQAKSMATSVVMLAKSMSLDDKPTEKDVPGKGLYTYHVTITRPDGVVLLLAKKSRKKKQVSFEDPVPVTRPLTRADVTGQ